MSLTAPERETIITLNDEDDTAHIWTAQRPWITRLKKNPSATLLNEGVHDGSVWAEFQVPKVLISVRTKRQTLSQGERAKRAARLNGKTAATPENAL